MEYSELRNIQERIKFDTPTMAVCLGISIRCYRNYLYGVNKIPPNVARAALELEQIEKQFDVARLSAFDARLVREYPHGIRSDIQ